MFSKNYQPIPYCFSSVSSQGTYTSNALGSNRSDFARLISSNTSGFDVVAERLTVSLSLIPNASSSQITGIPSQVGAKGARAKEQAFQLPLTGTLNCWHTPPRRPS